MSKKCFERISENPISKVLANVIGANDLLITSVYLNAVDGDNFKEGFLNYYKKEHPKAKVPDLNTKNANVVKSMISYFKLTRPSVDDTVDNTKADDYITRFGYASVFDREAGKNHVGVIMLDEYNNLVKKQIKQPEKEEVLEYYRNHAKLTWLNHIFEAIKAKSDKDITTIKKEYKEAEDRLTYLRKELGDTELSETDKNLLAVYQELFGSVERANAYIDEVLYNPIFSSIRQLMPNTTSESVTEGLAQQELESDTKESNGTSEDNDANNVEPDIAIFQYNNHLGTYSNYLMHVGERIKNYFNTLRKRSTPNVDDIDTYNSFGIAETMDATHCCSMLYNNISFSNIDAMIADIERTGRTVAGFEAFVQFANDLRANKDLAQEVFTVFAKTKMLRLESVVDENGFSSRQSNPNVNPNTALLFQFWNDVRGKVGDVDSVITEVSIGNTKSILEDAKALAITLSSIKNEKDLKETKGIVEDDIDAAIQQVIQLVKTYYPSAQNAAIKAYIEMNDKAKDNTYIQKINNIETLLSTISKIKTSIVNSNSTKIAQQRLAADIKAHNDKLDEERQKGNFVYKDEYQDPKRAYAEDYTANCYTAIANMVELLLPYSVVDTSLNSRNIHGNNNSDVINNSHITGLQKMFNGFRYDEDGNLRNDVLEKYLLERYQNTNQYKYSNLYFNQYDENGNLISEGLADVKNGVIKLNRNALHKVGVYLFNGASNMNTGENASYSEMMFGTFLPTAFMNFFNTETRYGEAASESVANYFTRTPSDAPKTFMFRGVRYNTDGLFKIKDREAYNKSLDEIVDTYAPIIDYDTFVSEYRNPPANNHGNTSDIRPTDLERYLFGKRGLFIKDAYGIKYTSEEDENGDREGYVTFITNNTSEIGQGIIFVMKGRVTKAGKGFRLNDASLVGIVNKNGISGENYNTNPVSSLIKSRFADRLLKEDITIGNKTWKKAEEEIDTNHVVFKLFKNKFKQEVLDAIDALNHYFVLVRHKETGNWCVKLDDNGPVLKDGVNPKEGYNYYHLGTSGNLIDRKNGEIKLNGNVFHSNKFTLIKTEERDVEVSEGKTEKRTVTYKENYLDSIISTSIEEDASKVNLLYGGALGIQLDESSDEPVVTDITFTEEQKAAIDEKLSEFLKDYRNQAIEELQAVKSNIIGVEVNAKNITEYALNSMLQFYNYDELLEGDSKFYKDAQTILKRAKEHQGSGVPYGIADYSSMHSDDLSDLDNRISYLNGGTIEEIDYDENGKPKKDENGKVLKIKRSIQDIFKGTIFEGVKQRRGFRAVTIKNTQRTNTKTLEELSLQLQFKPDGTRRMSKDKADTILFGPLQKDKKTGKMVRRGGFTETKVNDAQSYITIQEFMRRVAARGQLARYLPLFRKLTNPNAVFTAKDITEFVQVQKNFYYDLYYDKKYKKYVPRQIKNAELVLVPQLVKGTQLEQVYNMMRKAGIDQLNTVETSKAANENVLTLWDNDGNISDKTLKTFADEANKNAQVYSYNCLYTQQETPQHMNSENKAAIQIMKKMVDNLPDDDSELGKLKKEFMLLYNSNIEESFAKLLNELEIPIDKNGYIKIDENGNIEGLNKKVLLNKMKEEMARTGIDSNMIDYVTMDDNSTMTRMPSYMNNFLTKYESVTQSLFNNGITRQKLPGFHGVQVTNIGWKKASGVTDDISYAKELKYHPEGKGYIEVLLPYSFLGIDKNSKHYKNMTDEEILQELREEFQDNKGAKDNLYGLDAVLGYRIPTEGKQSACNMKVVGFISDAYGSTIVVPDDWVSQTGSDFDVDSVYGINYNTYKTRDGQVKKVPYLKEEDRDFKTYISYIFRNSNKEQNKDISKQLKEAYDNVTELFDDLRQQLVDEEQAVWDSCPEAIQNYIKKINADINNYIKRNKQLSKKEAYLYRLDTLKKELTKRKEVFEKGNDKQKSLVPKLEKVIEINDKIYALVNGDSYSFGDILKEDKLDVIEKAAEKAGLMSYNEYRTAHDEKANSMQARQNRILDIFQQILSHPDALEENLMRSNFDDLVAARNEVMNENVSNSRASRSAYNPFDQMRYQEEAMSGAELKAMSVTLDTFCSVCNTVKPTLTQGIKVIYDAKGLENPKDAAKRYGTKVNKDSTIVVNHNQYGWSVDNYNMADRILTSYSSQTTAFILDAIKEGSIPNLNQYSFSTFKTLANLGIDYRTSMAFIMQPGVSAILNAYNEKNSIYSDAFGNPIHEAIRNVAKQLGVEANYLTPITTILSNINEKYGDRFNELFGLTGDDKVTLSIKTESVANIPIKTSDYIDRIKERNTFSETSPVEDKALFDLGVILTFNRVHSIANEIQNIASVCNPDKFGAKQTVFATREVFEKIDDILYDKKIAFDVNDDGKLITKKVAKSSILEVDGKNILDTIYPGVADAERNVDEIIRKFATDTNPLDSKYTSLCSFLKYASTTSVIVAQTVFETRDPAFVELVTNVTSVFSGKNPKISEVDYREMQRYTLNSIYNEVSSIKYPVRVRKVDGRIKLEVVTDPDYLNEGDNVDDVNIKRINSESARIYGYGRTPNMSTIRRNKIENPDGSISIQTEEIPFEVVDINNPTDEELSDFEKLSPAQKVAFIQEHFYNSGIFGMLHTTLFNNAKRGKYFGMQTIEFMEQNMSPNIVYNEFKKAMFNTNPLIVSAAIDLVKYSVQVEGLIMSAKAINKIIDNSAFIEPIENGGIGFVDELRGIMMDLKTEKGLFADPLKVEQLYENYLRSHPNAGNVKTLRLNKKTQDKYKLYDRAYGTYFLYKNDDGKDANEVNKAFAQRMEIMGIYSSSANVHKVNKYVRIQSKDSNRLYKINEDPNHNWIILTPLGELAPNENAEWSCNENYNEGLMTKKAYQAMVNAYIAESEESGFTQEYITKKKEEFEETGEVGYLWYSRRTQPTVAYATRDFNFMQLADTESGHENAGALYELHKQMQRFYVNPSNSNKTLYVLNAPMTNYVKSIGEEFGSVQEVVLTDRNGRSYKQQFLIWKPKEIKKWDRLIQNKEIIRKDEEGNERRIDIGEQINNIQNPELRNIFRNLYGTKQHLDNLYAITPIAQEVNEENSALRASAIEPEFGEEPAESSSSSTKTSNNTTMAKAIAESMDFANSRRQNDNSTLAIDYLERLRANNVDYTAEHIMKNHELAMRETSNYASKYAMYIKEQLFDRFVEDPETPGVFLSITDPKVKKLIKESDKLANKYLFAINVAKAFIKKYEIFDNINRDKESSETKLHLETIDEAINTVKKLPIEDAVFTYTHMMADKVSTNPLVKEGLIDIMDAFWKSNGFSAKFHDIAENGTPILQVMLKDVFTDLDARQKATIREVRDYEKKLEHFKNLAIERGDDFDLDRIFDEDGKFIQDYRSEFEEKYNALRKGVQEAARLNDYGSIEYLKAKLAYDEFKADHINQECSPEYYKKRNAALRNALYGKAPNPDDPIDTGIRAIPELLSKYYKLYYERLELYHLMSKDGLSKAQRQRMNEISQEIYNLTRTKNYVNAAGELVSRLVIRHGYVYSEEEKAEAKIYGEVEAATLRSYLEALNQLTDEYFEYEPAADFEKQVETNLNIVRSFEQRDGNGIPQVPQDWLDAQPAYVEAKDWLKRNAKFVIDETRDEEGEPISIGAKIKDALKRLSMGGNGRSKQSNEISRNHNDGEGILDEKGIPDGRKLSDDEISRIKEAQEANFQVTHCPPFTDRILLSNASPIKDMFSAEFYAGITKDGSLNPEYLEVVTAINRLLTPYYNAVDGTVHIENIKDTTEGVNTLQQLAELYAQLRKIKKRAEAGNEEEVKAFIEENVEFETNKSLFINQNLAVQGKSQAFIAAWNELVFEHNLDGTLKEEDGKFVPNRYLYSYVKPKGEKGDSSYEKWIDYQKNEDLNLINSVYRKSPTKYYYQAKNEAQAKEDKLHDGSYARWYEANHVYNPYTRRMEPLDCWTYNEMRDEAFEPGSAKWEPKSGQRHRKVRDGHFVLEAGGTKIERYDASRDKRNPNYNKDKGVLGNYVKGSQKGLYDNETELSNTEKECRDWLQELVASKALTNGAISHFHKGYAPLVAKSEEMTLKKAGIESAKMLGVNLDIDGGDKDYYQEIGFENDRTPSMPMSEILKSKKTREYDEKIKQLKDNYPNKEEFATEAEYVAKIKEIDEEIDRLEKERREERQNLINRDWEQVFKSFIQQSNRYNSILDNTNKLYFLLDVVRDMKMYSRDKGLYGDLKRDSRRNSEDNPVYEMSTDDALIEQLETLIRRVKFDQWKEKEGVFTKAGNFMQAFTSANYMMLNFRGGIANITLGETGILAEAVAGEYFGKEAWAFGTGEWVKGSVGFARGGFENMFFGRDIAFNKQDAIVKYFNVVDYDEHTGVVRELTVDEYAQKLRDLMFSPQTIGEHFMQNSALFAMLHSNKLITTDDGETVYMTEDDYLRYKRGQALSEILTEEQLVEFDKFKKGIKENKDDLKEYAWFRKDVLTEFLYFHCDNDVTKNFIAEMKEKEAQFKEDFANEISMYDQIEFTPDGTLGFAEGSKLAELHSQKASDVNDVTKAEKLLGAFSEKVRKVNNKIHGVYNKNGAAYIEKYWWGSLVMQYHKHLPMGILKRYMARGRWNEFREGVDKGMVESVADLFTLNSRKLRYDAGMTEDDINALKAFVFNLTHAISFVNQLSTTWDIIPEYERANIRRNIGDLAGVVSGMATAAAIWAITDDDDRKNNTLANFILYESDRLASEAFMYNPYGGLQEAKKLMSQPVAANSIISDVGNLATLTLEYVFSDDYDPYYHTGRFAGQHKASVYIQRRIPIWSQINNILDINSSNKYYKIGKNPIGIFDIEEKFK